MAHLHLLLFIGMFFGCFVSVYTLAKICADRQEELLIIKDIKSTIDEFKEELKSLKNNT